MNIETMEKKLYDVCLKGDVEKLEALMREDELILARVSISSCFNQTPLHVASMLGHSEIAKSLLNYKPDFARWLDSQGRSPLHLASANGYVNIVKLLLEFGPKMCRVSDEDGRTPLHLAVMNGQPEAVSELIKVKSELHDQELGKVLHLCVMYNRLNVLILILQSTGYGQDLSNIKDDSGNTILHLATALRRVQVVKFLVMNRSGVDLNVVDENGLTALDIIEQMPKDVKTIEIKEILTSAGTSTTSSVLIPVSGSRASSREPWGSTDNNRKLGKMWNKMKNFTIFQEQKEKRDKSLLIATSVIAAMAYQAAISPPGGIAGLDALESSSNNEAYVLHPGSSLLIYFEPTLSDMFWFFNTISFLAALSVVFLFVSGATLKRRLYVWLIRAAVWVTLSSMILAYSCAVAATTLYDDLIIYVLLTGICTWTGMIGVSFLVVVYRSFSYAVRKLIKRRATRKKSTSTEDWATSKTGNINTV